MQTYEKYISKQGFFDRHQRCLRHAPAPGDPSLRSFRNIFRCQNVNIDIPRFENPPSLQIFKSNSSHVLDFFSLSFKNTNLNPLSSSTCLPTQFGSSTSRLRADWGPGDEHHLEKKGEKTGQNSSKS